LFFEPFASGSPVFSLVAFPMYAFTASGLLRSVFRLSCVKLCEIEVMVFLALPSLCAFIKVFIIKSSYFVGCWGRRLVSNWWLSRATVGWIGLGYQPGALAVLGSNPSDPTKSLFYENNSVLSISDGLDAAKLE
jgi:hypothetical protein